MPQLLLKLAQRLTHGLPVSVDALDHLEAQFAQLRRHIPRIIGRIAQRRIPVRAIANHQRGAGFSHGDGSGGYPQQQSDGASQ